jgi:hypothetical protein
MIEILELNQDAPLHLIWLVQGKTGCIEIDVIILFNFLRVLVDIPIDITLNISRHHPIDIEALADNDGQSDNNGQSDMQP